ncbi:hypothetical protein NQZ68_013336, partial [Dissostichus eleginoides]
AQIKAPEWDHYSDKSSSLKQKRDSRGSKEGAADFLFHTGRSDLYQCVLDCDWQMGSQLTMVIMALVESLSQHSEE